MLLFKRKVLSWLPHYRWAMTEVTHWVQRQDWTPICSNCRAWVLRQGNHCTIILWAWWGSSLETGRRGGGGGGAALGQALWRERAEWSCHWGIKRDSGLWREGTWDWKWGKDNKLCLDLWSPEWLKKKTTGTTKEPWESWGPGMKGKQKNRHRVASLGIRICWHCAQENQQTKQESKRLLGQVLINWFGRKIQLDGLDCVILITVSSFGQTELGSTLKVCYVWSLCAPTYLYILRKYKKWCFPFKQWNVKYPPNPPAWRLGKCIPCYFV